MSERANKIALPDFIGSLHAKFGENIANLDAENVKLIERVDERNRCIEEIRTELRRYCEASPDYRLACTDLLNEVFADFTVAMHLFSVGLIVPARMMVRRAFELGLAAIFFWDAPQEYWGWIKHDEDINFSKMTNHICSKGYQSYIAEVNKNVDFILSYRAVDFQEIYRTLSNTVHGKSGSLPPNSPERYDTRSNGTDRELQLTGRVQDLLLTVWCDRFPTLKAHLANECPRALR